MDSLCFSAIVVVPRPRAEDADPPLLGAVHEAVSGVGVESRDVDIVVARQHGGHMRHTAPDAVERRHGVVIPSALHEGLADAVPDETKVRGR